MDETFRFQYGAYMAETSVTLAAVAERAGVSKSTASKAFNDRADVAPQTRARVAAAAEELGYVPAVRPQAPGTTQVWVVFDRLANAYSATVLDGLLAEAQERDAIVIVNEFGNVEDNRFAPGSPAWIGQAQARGAQAFILVTNPLSDEHVAACRRRATPLIVVDPVAAAPEGVMSVGATNWLGGVQATEHLLSLGHTRLAFVGAQPASTPANERLAGFRNALETAGLDPNAAVVTPGTFDYDDGLACTELLRTRDRPTAIFAASDAVALGVLEAARQVGLRVPEDLSVVGFDDTFAAQAASPQLTTVRQPLTQMGRMAMQAAVEGARDGARLSPPVQLATTLVVRGSTAPPPPSPSGDRGDHLGDRGRGRGRGEAEARRGLDGA